MSLKNIILKSMATTMAISIVWGNISICGRGISKVIAENIAAPETEIELTNEKYVQYQNEEYAGVAVHSKLSVYPKQERNTYLPTQSVVAQVSLPRINGYLPERASVVEASTIATTGESQNTKVQQAYDVSSGLLVLSYENIPDQEGNLYAQFNENVKDEFEIIYIYPAEAYTGNEKAIDLNYAVNVKTSFQTGNEIITSQNEKNIKITEKENKKEITTFHITQLQGSIYKGFLYSNVENKTDYETKYKTVATFAVLNHQVINESILKLEEGSFILNNQEQTKIAANGMIEYEATGVSKYEFDRILGQEGKIEFYQGENVLATIQYVEIDHTKKLAVIYADGNMTILDDAETSAIIQYPKEVTALEIKISKPITEGFLHFENQNKIKASHDYGVAVKEIKKIRTTTKVNTYVAETDVVLQEPETKLTVSSSNSNFSTLQKSKATLTIKLDDTNASAKLLKDPTITIKLPDGITSGNLSSPEIVNGNGLKIKNTAIKNNIITITLEGKQKAYDINNVSGGVNIVMDIENMNFKDTMATHADKIEVTCQQDKEETKAQYPVNIVSKAGLLVISKLEGYDESNHTIKTLDNTLASAQIGEDKKEVNANQSIILVNNNNEEMDNVEIIGILSDDLSEQQKSTFIITLKEAVQLEGIDAKIEYSENKNGGDWKEEYTNAVKAYRIKLNHSLESKESLMIRLKIAIPEKIGYNQEDYITNQVSYTYGDINRTENYRLKLETNKIAVNENAKDTNSNNETKQEPITIASQVKVGKDVIEENTTVNERQVLKYIVTVTNNTNEDKNNLTLKTTIANAVYYELIESDEMYNLEGTTSHRYGEATNGDTIRETTLSIPANSSKQYSYQVVVNENIDKVSSNIEVIDASKNVLANKIIENNVKDAKVGLKVEYTYNEEKEITSNGLFPTALLVKNLTQKELKNVPVEIQLPEEVVYFDNEFYEEASINMEYDEQTHKISCNISRIPANTEYTIAIINATGNIDTNLTSKTVSITAQSTIDNETYFSNELIKEIKQIRSDLRLELKNDLNKDTVSDKDIINYTLEISNKGVIDYNAAHVYANFDKGVELKSASITDKDGKKKELEISNNVIDQEITIAKEDNFTVQCQVEINKNEFEINQTTLKNVFTVIVGADIVETEDSVFNIAEDSQNKGDNTPDDPSDDPTDPSDDNNQQDDNTGSGDHTGIIPEEQNSHSISGVAWLDQNKDGQRNEEEPLMNSVVVTLVNKQTGDFATDTNGNKITTTTDTNGAYSFTNLPEGTYLVLFEFDTTTYTVTTYQKEAIEETLNSDAIITNVTIDGQPKLAAITDDILLNDDKSNVDIGLIENATFDLSLDKQITKVAVINAQGTQEFNYNKGDTAKVDFVAKYISTANIVVNYQFTITNEGDTIGYVDSLVDDLPSGLEFSSELNKDWYVGSDGKLYTTSLSGIAIQPGRSTTIDLILTKNMTEDSTGVIPNNAALQKISNLENIAEADTALENNESSATLILSIKTGSPMLYAGITLGCIAIIAVGAYFIKKKVLDRGI